MPGASNEIIKEKWKLVPGFLKVRGLVNQHIESYNHFVEHGLQKIILANKRQEFKEAPGRILEFLGISVDKPQIVDNAVAREVTPQECRLRDLTYYAPIIVKFRYKPGSDKDWNKTAQFRLGKLPVMLRSCKCVLKDLRSLQDAAEKGECPYDPGGYFIINGREKVITIQEQLKYNRIIVEGQKAKEGEYVVSVVSQTAFIRTKTCIISKKLKLYLSHNSLKKNDVPICIVLRALGLESDQEMIQLIGADVSHELGPSIQEARNINAKGVVKEKIVTQTDAINYVGKSVVVDRRKTDKRTAFQEGMMFLLNKLVPNVDCPDGSFRNKAIYICVLVRRILLTMKEAAQPLAEKEDLQYLDDVDYYGNKRLELAGQLLATLFESAFKDFQKHLDKRVNRHFERKHRAAQFNMKTCLAQGQTTMTQTMERTISKGVWDLRRWNIYRPGITDNLARLTYQATLGMMCKVSSSVVKSRKTTGPRALQPSQWGMLCPAETPEGESCGLVKNLALTTHITVDLDPTPVRRAAFSLGVSELITCWEHALILLSGTIIGVHQHPKEFVRKLRSLRRSGLLDPFVGMYFNRIHRCVYISCDQGRVMRPLIIVEQGKLILRNKHMKELEQGIRVFDDFIADGIVEYLDVNEENDALIATSEADVTLDHTHLEIDPMTILGVVANLIPHPNHNQSPRNTYQCAMGKQAQGVIGYNQNVRCDSAWYNLVHLQRPLVQTKVVEIINFHKLPAGTNTTLAVMSYSGYDIEDAIIVNRSSLDRGFGRCMQYSTHKCEFRQDTTFFDDTEEFFVGPKEGEKVTQWERAIDKDGICLPGRGVSKGNILVNKFSKKNGEINREQLKFTKKRQARVDRVLFSQSHKGWFFKVVTRDTRVPEIGDKFSSRHGQKGVCGLIVNQEDLPFSDLGICPDLIMNPHGFPSRMTVGKMIELVSGKLAVHKGTFGDSTAFGGDQPSDICRELVSKGFSYTGKDFLTSGITGEPLRAYIFMGPVYYQQLKHMVSDKMHARAGRGPRESLTRQPTGGRSKDGGLRIGEMERDCLVGHGAAMTMYERFMVASDRTIVHTCQVCGYIGQKTWCQYCKKSDTLCEVEMPYCCKLLFQELMSMHIRPRIHLSSNLDM